MTAETTTNSKSLKELRALAKARGLTGYSKSTKPELLRQLAKRASKPTSTKKPAARKAPAAASSKSKQIKRAAAPGQAKPAKSKSAAAAVDSPPTSASVHPVANEQWVESAKYALRPNGRVAHESGADLDEDIERLPELREPVVCLLPQQPGVLHAYWVLPPDESTAGTDYKLRLGRSINGTVRVIEEISVAANQGNWYFKVPEPAGAFNLLIELGYYRDGRFVAARGRSIARLPSLHASSRIDERWWVSEAEFKRMYSEAGGVVAGTQAYGLIGPESSPTGFTQKSS